MWQPQVWAQSFNQHLNDAVGKANEIKKQKTSSYEYFQIIFYAVHMAIGVVGILMFVYGVTIDEPQTIFIGFGRNTTVNNTNEYNYNPNVTFLIPVIMIACTLVLNVGFFLNCMNKYTKHLLCVFFFMVLASIITLGVLFSQGMTFYNSTITSQYDKNQEDIRNCIEYCSYHGPK